MQINYVYFPYLFKSDTMQCVSPIINFQRQSNVEKSEDTDNHFQENTLIACINKIAENAAKRSHPKEGLIDTVDCTRCRDSREINTVHLPDNCLRGNHLLQNWGYNCQRAPTVILVYQSFISARNVGNSSNGNQVSIVIVFLCITLNLLANSLG